MREILSDTHCLCQLHFVLQSPSMPRLWTRTIESHRREVRDAITDATTKLVATRGLASVTMAEIAKQTGIGRATLYKYFDDVETILVAAHERHVEHHLQELSAARDRSNDRRERLEAVLRTYARISYERSRAHTEDAEHSRGHQRSGSHRHTDAAHHRVVDADVAALVHRTQHVDVIQRRLTALFREVIRDAAKAGLVRTDVPAEELAAFCIASLGSAARLSTPTAVDRRVALTLDAVRTPRTGRVARG